jgi:hypothetical protein
VLSDAVNRKAKYADDHFIYSSEVTEDIPDVIDFSSEFYSSLTEEKGTLENGIRYLSVWKPLKLLKFSHV